MCHHHIPHVSCDTDCNFQLFKAREVHCRDSQPSLYCGHLEGASPKAKDLILHAVTYESHIEALFT